MNASSAAPTFAQLQNRVTSPRCKGSPADRVDQLGCLVRKLGKDRYWRGLDLSTQAVDGRLPLIGCSFQIP